MNGDLRIKLKAGQDCSHNFIWGWIEFALLRNEVLQKESHTGRTSKCREKMRKMPWKAVLVIFLSGIGRVKADGGSESVLPWSRNLLLVSGGGWITGATLGSLGCSQSRQWSTTISLPSEINIPSTLSYFCGLQPAQAWTVTFCSEHSVLMHSTTKSAFQFGAKSFNRNSPFILHPW